MVTGYGTEPGSADRVAFGDDAAAAGGLVVWDERGPCFCADAVADPVTGLATAELCSAPSPPGASTCSSPRWPTWPGTRRRARIGGGAIRSHGVLRRGGAGMSDGLLVVGVDVDGERVDVRCANGVVTAVGTDVTPRRGETVVRGAAAAVPGLHDHHLHLMAMAARADSVDVGAERVSDGEDLARVLAAADAASAAGEWLRAVGYHERVLGRLDRWTLDRIVEGRPLRVQHRSGHLWVLNSAGCRAVGLDVGDVDGGLHGDCVAIDGIERDGSGRATGRLFDRDEWLADRLPRREPPDLGPVGRRLASYGVTGVTDATPTAATADLEPLAAARRTGTMAQRIRVMGGLDADAPCIPHGLDVGPLKVMVADGRQPDVDGLVDRIDAAHRSGRPVALHCVSLVAAAVGLPAAWDVAGARPATAWSTGRCSPRTWSAGWPSWRSPWSRNRRSSSTGVTSTSTRSTPGTRAHLYRCAGLARAGVERGRHRRSVRSRGSVGGRRLGGPPVHPVGPGRRGRRAHGTPDAALDLFLSDPADPGGPPRTISVGASADLCLLGDDLDRTLDDPTARRVVTTVVAGRVIRRGLTGRTR